MFERKFLTDLAERVIWTFVQAAGAVVLVEGFDASAWKIAATAGGIAVVKCVIAYNVGAKNARLG